MTPSRSSCIIFNVDITRCWHRFFKINFNYFLKKLNLDSLSESQVILFTKPSYLQFKLN